MTCAMDAAQALSARRKPILCVIDHILFMQNPEAERLFIVRRAEDSDHDPPDILLPHSTPLQSAASLTLSTLSRDIATSLYIPSNEQGIPLAVIKHLISFTAGWRDVHLGSVGVPAVWPPAWDFVAAVTACETRFLPLLTLLLPIDRSFLMYCSDVRWC